MYEWILRDGSKGGDLHLVGQGSVENTWCQMVCGSLVVILAV